MTQYEIIKALDTLVLSEFIPVFKVILFIAENKCSHCQYYQCVDCDIDNCSNCPCNDCVLKQFAKH